MNTVDGHNQIDSIFQYKTSTIIECLGCRTSFPTISALGADESYVFDLHVLKYLDIRNISTSKKIDFMDLLNYTLNETTLHFYTCVNCHTCDSAKLLHVKFKKLPEVLIFRVLVRNVNYRGKVIKLNSYLHYPLDNLELTCDSAENNNSNSQTSKKTYKLCAIVHYKQSKSDLNDIQGHYTCYIRFAVLIFIVFYTRLSFNRSSLNQWYEINDICVTKVTVANIEKINISNVDLLFYRTLSLTI